MPQTVRNAGWTAGLTVLLAALLLQLDDLSCQGNQRGRPEEVAAKELLLMDARIEKLLRVDWIPQTELCCIHGTI
jgi:hypothetical protein